MALAIRSSYSRPPASAAISRWARRCCRRRAASASTSIRSAAAAASAAAARCWSPRASSPSTASPHRARACRRSASRKCATRAARRWRRAAPVLLGTSRGRCRHRRARQQPGASPGGAQGGRCARDRAESGGAPALRAGASSRTCTIRPATCAGCSRRWKREWSLTDLHLRSVGAADAAADSARRRLAGHGRGARRQADHRRLAGAARARLRPRGRHRLDDHRRASVRSDERRGGGLRGRHESADPLRRGSDEPRVLFDDESGRRRADDRGGARGALRARRWTWRRAAGISHEDILEATLVGNPIMHHLLLGIDPVELGGAPFALATDHSLTLRANVIDLQIESQRAHLRAALHRRTRRRRCRRHGARRAAGSRRAR